MNSNLPNGYSLQGKYRVISPKMNRIVFWGSILLWIPFGWLFLHMNSLIRPEFDGFEFIRRLTFESSYIARTQVLGIALIAILLYGFIHEAVHGIFFRVFSHRRPNFGFKINPYTTLALGAFISRNQAIMAALSPLLIITLLGLIIWPFVPVTALPIVLLILSVNIASSTCDLIQSGWLLHYSTNVMYGFDGRDSVVHGPIDIENK